MSEACNVDEDLLFDYLAGLLTPSQRAFIEGHPACVARTKRLAAEIAVFEAALYRVTCPTSDDLVSYQEHHLDKPQARSVSDHVRHCTLCQAELALLDAIDAIPLMSDDVASRIRRQIEAFLQPALKLQFRGQAQIYATPEVVIPISLKRSTDRSLGWTLTGELMRQDGTPFPETIERILLQHVNGGDHIAEMNQDRTFVVRHLGVGTYRLIIETIDVQFIIKTLIIGNPLT